jgi:hypothetical protein
MASKSSADIQVAPIIADLLETPRFSELREAMVTVDADFIYRGKNGAWALKWHGSPAAAVIKKNSVDMRRKGIADCTITIEASHWQTLCDRKKEGLIAHELRHIEVCREKKSQQIREDDASRPVLRLLDHDWNLGGFADIAAAYGEDAPEVEAVQALMTRHHQLFFTWSDDRMPPLSLVADGSTRL